MFVRNVTRDQIERAAHHTGVLVHDLKEVGEGYQFTLRPLNHKYQKTSASYVNRGHKVNAVCFHGHFDFMVNLFKQEPNAHIRTMYETYNNQADFHAKAQYVGDRDIGPQVAPLAMRKACDCE